jgi:Tfp pilus assembly protein PilF
MAATSLILLLCLTCVSSGIAQESKPTVRHHREAEDPAGSAVARGEAAIDKHDYVGAETELKKAVQLDPENYRGWYDLGLVYNATDRSAEAIAAYKKSVAANPKLFESNFNLGVLLGRAGDPEAAKYLRAASDLSPGGEHAQVLAVAWMLLAKTLKGEEQVDAFRRAAQFDPASAAPHLAAARAAEENKNVAAAEAEYKAAAQLEPKNSDAIAGLANLYIAGRRLPEAEAALRKYLAINPQNARAHLLLGHVLGAEDKAAEAQPEFERALELAPGDAAISRDLAFLYIDNHEFAKAEPLFREALKHAPKDAELHHRLGTCLLEQKKFSEAQIELLNAVNLKPDYGIAYGDLAFAASENANYPLALKALDARAKFLPDIPATLFLRATTYDHLGAKKEAAASYHQFLAAANGKFPEQEWQAKHRLLAIEPKKQ